MDPAKGHQTITPFRHIPDATTMLEVFKREMGESQFEIDLAAQKRKRAAEFRDARNAKRAQAAEDALSQRPVLFHKDGATQLEEGEGRMEIDF